MHARLPAAGGGDILLKPRLQKRLMDHSARCGKHLGCLRGRWGIAVRTKWQSGTGVGNPPAYLSKGNRSCGNGEWDTGKSGQT